MLQEAIRTRAFRENWDLQGAQPFPEFSNSMSPDTDRRGHLLGMIISAISNESARMMRGNGEFSDDYDDRVSNINTHSIVSHDGAFGGPAIIALPALAQMSEEILRKAAAQESIGEDQRQRFEAAADKVAGIVKKYGTSQEAKPKDADERLQDLCKHLASWKQAEGHYVMGIPSRAERTWATMPEQLNDVLFGGQEVITFDNIQTAASQQRLFDAIKTQYPENPIGGIASAVTERIKREGIDLSRYESEEAGLRQKNRWLKEVPESFARHEACFDQANRQFRDDVTTVLDADRGVTPDIDHQLSALKRELRQTHSLSSPQDEAEPSKKIFGKTVPAGPSGRWTRGVINDKEATGALLN